MRLSVVSSRRVVWEDGMHLTPQHLQAQRRYQDDQAVRTIDLLFPFSYGLAAIAIDAEALHNGTLSLLHARGVLPDGTGFDTSDADAAPAPVALRDRFSPTRDTHVVHLALPPWRSDGPNVGDGGAPAAGSSAPATRYRMVEVVVTDESTGADPAPVRFAARNLHFLLDDEVSEGVVSMPCARIRRDGRGQFQLDPDFIPPTLHVGASERLSTLLQRTVAMLHSKGSALEATVSSAPSGAAGGAAAYAGNEMATRWLLHAVRSADAPLRHLLATRATHPERLYLELSRLTGALCTFSVSAHPRDLPPYDHQALTECFDALEAALRAQLDVMISARAVVTPLQRTTPVLHVATIGDPRCFEPGARWFLGVRAGVGTAELVERVERLTKSCASEFMERLVASAYSGLVTEHIPMAPAALAPKPDLTYFELTMAGPCAIKLAATREMAVYVPDALPDAYLEVAVLVPQ